MSEGFESKSTADAKKSFRTQKKPTEVADIGCIQQSLVKHFRDIKDPRVERTNPLLSLWGNKYMMLILSLRHSNIFGDYVAVNVI